MTIPIWDKNTIKKLTTDNIKETFPKTINPQYLSIINRLAPINKRLAIFAKSKLTPTRILSKYSHNRYLEKWTLTVKKSLIVAKQYNKEINLEVKQAYIYKE